MKTARIERWLPWLVFAAILIHGASFGLTDDEAYYWVLAQKPALGYAFHPPAVALFIAAAQAALGWLLGHHSVALVRLPAALSCAGLVALVMGWVGRAARRAPQAGRGGWVVTAFAGLFALSWMMVPDMPLFVGWTIAFVATWEICFAVELSRTSYFPLLSGLCFGTALAILGKYSGVLAAASAFAAIWLWAPRERRLSSTGALALGVGVAALPILWWNSEHQWASILYQIRERHGDAQLSLVRYLRFWAIEIVLMGPALLLYSAGLLGRVLKRQGTRPELFALVWAGPAAAVFCTQPLWSDFKPHWAFIVWWPLLLSLAWATAQGQHRRLTRFHLAYGWSVIALVWLSCHVPIGSWAVSRFRPGIPDPKMDVTNDLYGWPDLRAFVVRTLGEPALGLPVLGSRYQTAAQAAFAMGEGARVTLLPRDLKAMDEWPDLGVSDGQGPEWPRLRETVLYVSDNRYVSGPGYPGAACAIVGTLEKERFGFPAKTIFLWKCESRSARP